MNDKKIIDILAEIIARQELAERDIAELWVKEHDENRANRINDILLVKNQFNIRSRVKELTIELTESLLNK